MGRKQDHILDGDSYLSIALCHISFFKRRKSPVFQDSPRNFRFEGSILCSAKRLSHVTLSYSVSN